MLEQPEYLVRSLVTQEVHKELTTVVLFDSQNLLLTVSALRHIEEIPRDSPKRFRRLLSWTTRDDLGSVRLSAVFAIDSCCSLYLNVLRTTY